MTILMRRYLILLVLALIFMSPLPLAYLFYYHPHWLSGTSVNRGRLLTPSIALPDFQAKSAWHVVMWSPVACDVACFRQVDKLMRLRLALGRHYYDVDTWLITTQAPMMPLLDKSIQVKIVAISSNAAHVLTEQKASMFIVDAQGYIVLAYDAEVKLDDIYHDIRQLLRSSGKISE